MKKTLFALTALFAGVASADSLENWTLEQATAYPGTGGGSYCGVQFNLSDALSSGTAVLTEGESALPAELNLDTVTLQLRDTASETTRYLYLVDSTNTVVGISTETASGSASDILTFNFEGVTLSSTETYKAYLSSSSVEVGSAFQAGQYNSAQLAAAPIASGASAASYGLLNAAGLASTGYTPSMTISVSTPAVPEPATATLSLLALAGLAARRRRK